MRLPPQWGRLTELASSWWHALCLCPTRQPRAVDHHPSQSHLDLCRVSLWTTSRRASMNWLCDVPYIIGPSSWDVPRRGRPVPPAAHESPAAVSPASNWACDASSQGTGPRPLAQRQIGPVIRRHRTPGLSAIANRRAFRQLRCHSTGTPARACFLPPADGPWQPVLLGAAVPS